MMLFFLISCFAEQTPDPPRSGLVSELPEDSDDDWTPPGDSQAEDSDPPEDSDDSQAGDSDDSQAEDSDPPEDSDLPVDSAEPEECPPSSPTIEHLSLTCDGGEWLLQWQLGGSGAAEVRFALDSGYTQTFTVEGCCGNHSVKVGDCSDGGNFRLSTSAGCMQVGSWATDTASCTWTGSTAPECTPE